MLDLLDALYELYRQHAPVVLDKDRIPAKYRLDEARVAAFEEELGAALPADYRTFLLQNDIAHNFAGNFRCLMPVAVPAVWKDKRDMLRAGTFDGWVERKIGWGFTNWDSGRLRKVWWSEGWIPVAEDSCANLICLDGDPGPDGVLHQVINMEVQDGQGPFCSTRRSFTDLVQEHLDLLRAGKFTVEEWGIEVDRWA